MKNSSVVVDVGIDHGGALESSRPTTHSAPTFVEEGVVHYCVANIPGAVGRTSSQALCNATLPYARSLARLGAAAFGAIDPGHAAAINILDGHIVHLMVHEAFPELPFSTSAIAARATPRPRGRDWTAARLARTLRRCTRRYSDSGNDSMPARY